MPNPKKAAVAGLVLADGTMSSNPSGAGEIRKSPVEANLVDRMVALRASAAIEEGSALAALCGMLLAELFSGKLRGAYAGRRVAQAAS